MVDPADSASLAAHLRSIPAALPEPPRALLVVSAHWETPVPTVSTHPRPPLFYDYYGFPAESYRITWPAPGEPALAARVRSLLGAAGLPSAEDAGRGFDHGCFIPLKVAFPAAQLPTVQLSLQAGLDPAAHLRIGAALAPLREEGVLIVGSGMSFHNMRGFGAPGVEKAAAPFHAWLEESVTLAPAARDARLRAWGAAPGARVSHPREEHLLPLMVAAGAAGPDLGRVAWSGRFARCPISSVAFGAYSV